MLLFVGLNLWFILKKVGYVYSWKGVDDGIFDGFF